MSSQEHADEHIDAAIANAALDGVSIEDDERELIRQHQTGQISHAEFLARAADLARRKSDGGR